LIRWLGANRLCHYIDQKTLVNFDGACYGRLRRDTPAGCLLIVQRKSDFDRHLPVLDLAFVDVAAGFYYLKPAHAVDSLSGFGQGTVNGIFNAGLGSADQFDSLIDVITHAFSFLRDV
jgi:hypothetical protein